MKQDEWYWRLRDGEYVVGGTMCSVYDCVSKKMCDRIDSFLCWNNIYRRSGLKIKKMVISIRADYDKMTARHYLQQPRCVMESQLIKHTSKASKYDKYRKNYYLASKYQIIS